MCGSVCTFFPLSCVLERSTMTLRGYPFRYYGVAFKGYLLVYISLEIFFCIAFICIAFINPVLHKVTYNFFGTHAVWSELSDRRLATAMLLKLQFLTAVNFNTFSKVLTIWDDITKVSNLYVCDHVAILVTIHACLHLSPDISLDQNTFIKQYFDFISKQDFIDKSVCILYMKHSQSQAMFSTFATMF